METMINLFMYTYGICLLIFWMVVLYCAFIVDYCKGSKQYYWIKKHLITDEDIEPLD